jgi:predicted rRNA methylase YqxC with S4 and FtsJ domains
VVRDEEARRRAIEDTVAGLERLGLSRRGVVDSAVAGAQGNREAFALFERT